MVSPGADSGNFTTPPPTPAPLTSGDAAYWPDWVNYGLPLLAILSFIITVVFSVKYGGKRTPNIEIRVPVIVTKNDVVHSNASITTGRSDGSDDKKSESKDTVSDMLQKAKEQAMNSRAGRRLSSLRSRVSQSSFDYSPLDECSQKNSQLPQDSSDEESESMDKVDNTNVVTVDIEHHSPPRNPLISSEDSGFNEASTRTSSVSETA